MGTQFKCNECGTVTEAAAGRCPVCGTPATSDTGAPAPSTNPAAQPDSDMRASPQAPAGRSAPLPRTAPQPVDRPDPYTQYGNPLHDNWGEHAPVHPPASPTPLTARRKRPWVGRVVVMIVVLALMGTAWVNRAWLDEKWDSVYAQVEEWTGE